MKRILFAVAAVATVLASILPAYAQQQIDCSVATKANFAQCVIQNSQTGGE